MAAPDLPIITHALTLHGFGGSLRAISLNWSYLSHLKSDRLETCCIRFKIIKNLYFESKNIKNYGVKPSILPFYWKTYSFQNVIFESLRLW